LASSLLPVLGILVKRSAFALGFLLVWNIEWIAKGILVFTIFPDKKIADAIIQFYRWNRCQT
jgi:hypothetical protein